MTATELEAVRLMVEESITDRTAWLVYADAIEESGQTALADAWRRLAASGRFPEHWKKHPPQWAWWCHASHFEPARIAFRLWILTRHHYPTAFQAIEHLVGLMADNPKLPIHRGEPK